jgi:phosphatidylserine/phosphatidylglycerophosphate/cardiolipin synthase-like enzyme
MRETRRTLRILALALLFCWTALAPGVKAGAEAQPWAVYFSPQGGCTEAIVTAVSQARTSIHVQAYSFSSYPITKAIIAAQARGVRVEVILDKSQLTEKYSALPALLAAQVPTWIDPAHQIAHNKIMIIDGKTVITGSFNFTKAAEERNAENLLIIHSQQLANQYVQNWQLHERHSEPYSRTTSNDQRLPIHAKRARSSN